MYKRNDMMDNWSLKFMRMFVFVCFLLLVFAAEGQKTASSMYLKGNVRRLYIYKHLAKNLVIDNNTLVSYEKGKLLNHVDFIFDKNGLLLAENRFDKNDIIYYSYIYTYEDDKLVDVTEARAGKFQVERTEYKYDKTGKKSQAIIYDNKDSLQNTIVYRHDSLNNLVAEETYNTLNWDYVSFKSSLSIYFA
jgi:antitoxin component YwqK of YwqJK toxin-antitoxin module